jgi:hypothetical protein
MRETSMNGALVGIAEVHVAINGTLVQPARTTSAN